MDISISIIVPCYNARKSIEQCLDTITVYDNVEIIMVDDCSTDDTVSVIEEYISKHSNCQIRLIKNVRNQGAGESRNIGIKHATKEYITFVDSDDGVERDFFEIINKVLVTRNIDCLVYDAYYVKNASKTKFSMFFSDSLKEGYIDQKACVAFIKGAPWGKIYKTKIIQDNCVVFAKLTRNEDVVFTKTAMSFCKNVYYIKKPLYSYYDVVGSLMNNKGLLTTQNAFNAYEQIYKSISLEKYQEELIAIYLIEVVYSTTLTCISLGLSRNKIRKHFYKVWHSYKSGSQGNKYYSQLSLKYKIVLGMMRSHLFCVLKIIRNFRGKNFEKG